MLFLPFTLLHTGVCETNTLWKIVDTEMLALRTPNQGLDCSFCRWVAGHGLAEKECVFTDSGRTSRLQPLQL